MDNFLFGTALDKIAAESDFNNVVEITRNTAGKAWVFKQWLSVDNRTIQYYWYPTTVVGANPDNLSGSGLNLESVVYREDTQLVLRVKFSYDLLDRVFLEESSTV